MIESFKHKGLRLFFEHDNGSKLIPALLPRIRLILSALDAAESVEGMDNPIFKLHPLKGKLEVIGPLRSERIGGSHSVSIMGKPKMWISWITTEAYRL